MMRKILLAAGISLLATVSAHAACSYKNEVPLKSLSAGFEAWKAVSSTMAECGNYRAELDQNFAQKQMAAFSANPALYQIGGVANETLVPVLQEGLIRPLDELVAKYGQNLNENQLIKVDGKIVAVAMMVNAQHLVFRKDILESLAISVPKTYDDVLAAAKKIKDAKAVQYPLGGTFKTGYDLGEEFVNMYLGFGGEFFDSHNVATVNNEKGVKALNMLKALSQYMDPEFLVSDSTYVQQQFQQGKIAIANLWASRAGALENASESKVVGKIGVAAAPAAFVGGKPATTIWWDGITIASHIPDEQADAAFRLAMEGIKPEMVKEHNDAAVWLIKGYQPTPVSKGAFDSAEQGAPPYPASTALGILHTALGNHLGDFLTGRKSAEDALSDVEAEYKTAAKEKGLIK
ncbi:ABC transporter substrate-binding protein [Rhizobium sp. BK176]|uniref:ABC transporter substrate-binding protein n=1 Tax=Rhizobium sp. BK176 TaxID=2587071 RepID=UPI0021697BA6|nr:extracellular solute-binding protein [Rhizobium sp. BK176]MCS4096208.1 ABC-type glycerol-3-phosphate transport system substrate-binding protein [Rhizobium sp. BK176]